MGRNCLSTNRKKRIKQIQKKKRIAKRMILTGLFNLNSEAMLKELDVLPVFITGCYNLSIRYADEIILIVEK